MKTCQCSQCGLSAESPTWGLTLLVRDGWAIAHSTTPPGAAERAWLCSECGRRTRKLARQLAKLSAPEPARARKSRALKVLLIDDHVLILRGMVRLLVGCHTVVASSAQQAWSLLQSGQAFDVIVSDVMMPGMAGPELYERCVAQAPHLARRFLFTSADPLTARRMIDEAALRVGASEAPPLLNKPASGEALLAAVSAVASAAAQQSGTYALRLPSGLASERR